LAFIHFPCLTFAGQGGIPNRNTLAAETAPQPINPLRFCYRQAASIRFTTPELARQKITARTLWWGFISSLWAHLIGVTMTSDRVLRYRDSPPSTTRHADNRQLGLGFALLAGGHPSRPTSATPASSTSATRT
jgi:hypothetical protein